MLFGRIYFRQKTSNLRVILRMFDILYRQNHVFLQAHFFVLFCEFPFFFYCEIFQSDVKHRSARDLFFVYKQKKMKSVHLIVDWK